MCNDSRRLIPLKNDDRFVKKKNLNRRDANLIVNARRLRSENNEQILKRRTIEKRVPSLPEKEKKKQKKRCLGLASKNFLQNKKKISL
ncbi:hypothetical protein PGB90_002067 [Kerria lacca]